jgi:hypothetical protein
MFCNMFLCDSFMVLCFNDFHVKLLFLYWFHFEIKHDFFGTKFILNGKTIYLNCSLMLFYDGITYLITIMTVQTFESEHKFNVSLQNHIEPQPLIIVTTSIAYKLYHLYFFIE